MCRDATRLLSRMQEGDVSLSDRIKVRLHLLACDACTRFERQLRFLAEAMRRYKS
jgi:Putative zinc-finger